MLPCSTSTPFPSYIIEIEDDSDECPTRSIRSGSDVHAERSDGLEGAVLDGRYLIEAQIGRGGMGDVYLARHHWLDRQFAIKVLRPPLGVNPKMRKRFASEAECSGRLSHPNLVSVVDFGETPDGLLYLVMEFISGCPLTQVIAAEAPLPQSRVIGLLRQICQGLAHAHDAGLVHRDLKPSNILIDSSNDGDDVRIVDFGLARSADSAVTQQLTSVGFVLGTPRYMAPEQASGEDIDHRADLFALGLVTYEMLCGLSPFKGDSVEVVKQNLCHTPPQIAERVPGLIVNEELERIVHKLMEKDPAARFQSAHSVIEALDALEVPVRYRGDTHDTVVVRDPAGSDDSALPWWVWRPWLGASIALVCMLACGLAVAAWRPAPPAGISAAGADSRRAMASMMHRSMPAGERIMGMSFDGFHGSMMVPQLTEKAPTTAAVAAQTGPAAPAPVPARAEPPQPRPAPAEVGAVASAAQPNASVPKRAAQARPNVAAKRRDPSPATTSPGPVEVRARRSAARDGVEELSRLHREVGEQLGRLAEKRPGAATAALRDAYFSISISDGLRNPALQPKLIGELRQLRREIRRELRRGQRRAAD